MCIKQHRPFTYVYALEWPRDKQARFFQSYLQGEAKMFYNQLQVNVKQDIQ